jgi:hypothetical protein
VSHEAEDALRTYYTSVEKTINLAKAQPGLKDQEIEDHLTATDTLSTQLATEGKDASTLERFKTDLEAHHGDQQSHPSCQS